MRIALLTAAVIALACHNKAGGGGPGGDPLDGVPTTQTISGVPQLSAKVSVVQDGLGVPHIYAASDGDAAFALGYVQARDRFFEMDLLRKFARGRSGELLGVFATADAVRQQDVFIRTMFTSTRTSSTGSHHIEDIIVEQLPPDVRAVGERYRDGVNAWLGDLKAGRNLALLHPQYLVLAFTAGEIAPWTLEDSAAIGRLQTLQLSDSTAQELGAGVVFASGLAADVTADLLRHAQAVPSVVLNSPAAALQARAALSPAPPATAAALQASLAGARSSLEAALAARLQVRLPLGDRTGSNNWAVAPARTAGGHALLANDPHLSLSNPPNFHMVHLVTPTRNVAGVAFPGAPVVVIGHNTSIAWGSTTAFYDVTDLYVEQLDATTSPPTVLLNGARVPVQVVSETRKIRGLPDDPYTILIVPHRGPILPSSLTPGQAISVRWTGQDPTFELKAFLDLNAAKSVDEAFSAVSSFGVGAQNFVFADVLGHIGYFPRALVPIRKTGAPTCLPWLPMDGTTDACDWTGFLADAQLPQAKDPSKGYLATANNDITGALVPPGAGQDANLLAAPHYLQAFTDIGFREQRIQERLEATSQHTLDGMTSLQADNHSKLAEVMMPGLLALLQGQTLTPAAQAAVSVWTGWDFSTPRGDETGVPEIAQHAAASAAFHAFIGSFAKRVLGPHLPAAISIQSIPAEFSLKIPVGLAQGAANPAAYPLVAPAATWCGGDCAPVVVAALEEAVTRLGQALPSAQPGAWRWGDLHHVLFGTPLRSGSLTLLPDFGPFPNDGGLFTVDVANFDLFDGSGNPSNAFEQHDGANVRMATELDPAGVRSRMVIPGGEVDRPPVLGLPAGPHYMDQVPAWLANQPGDQPFAQADVIKAAAAKVVFTP
jgi:penicillin amidase